MLDHDHAHDHAHDRSHDHDSHDPTPDAPPNAAAPPTVAAISASSPFHTSTGVSAFMFPAYSLVAPLRRLGLRAKYVDLTLRTDHANHVALSQAPKAPQTARFWLELSTFNL